MRGIAVLPVLLSHASLLGLYVHPALNFENSGKYGVYLFFVLSAYLLDKQICLNLKEKGFNRRYWKNYFFRRVSRIFPLFVLALFANYFLTEIGLQEYAINLKKEDLMPHLLLADGKHIFWSIPVEFKYYFLSPLIIAFCGFFLRWDLKLIFIFFGFLIVVSILLSYARVLGYFDTVSFLPVFLCGAFVAVMEVVDVKVYSKKFLLLLKLAAGGSVLIVILTFKHLFQMIFDTTAYPFHHLLFYSFYGVLANSVRFVPLISVC